MTRREQAIITGFALTLAAGSGSLYWYHSGTNDLPPATDPAVIAPNTADQPPTPGDPKPGATPGLALDEPQNATPKPAVDATPVEVAVAVQGAIAQPGLYKLTNADRVQDLIDEAGGTLDNADLSTINRAARLIDGTTLTIPRGTIAERDGNTLRMRRVKHAVWNPPAYTVYGQPQTENAAPGAAPSLPASLLQNPDGGFTGRIDLNRATTEELQRLPGIGPVFAAAIIEYRNAAPFRSVDELDQVSGIGPKRLQTLRPLVKVD